MKAGTVKHEIAKAIVSEMNGEPEGAWYAIDTNQDGIADKVVFAFHATLPPWGDDDGVTHVMLFADVHAIEKDFRDLPVHLATMHDVSRDEQFDAGGTLASVDGDRFQVRRTGSTEGTYRVTLTTQGTTHTYKTGPWVDCMVEYIENYFSAQILGWEMVNELTDRVQSTWRDEYAENVMVMERIA